MCALGKKFAFGKNKKQQEAKITRSNNEKDPQSEGVLEEYEEKGNRYSEEEEVQGDDQEYQEEYEHAEVVTKNNHVAANSNVPLRVNKSTTTVNIQNAPISQPVKSRPRQPDDDDRVTLSAKINRSLHSRLKIHSYKTHINIAGLLESWIEQNFPEA